MSATTIINKPLSRVSSFSKLVFATSLCALTLLLNCYGSDDTDESRPLLRPKGSNPSINSEPSYVSPEVDLERDGAVIQPPRASSRSSDTYDRLPPLLSSPLESSIPVQKKLVCPPVPVVVFVQSDLEPKLVLPKPERSRSQLGLIADFILLSEDQSLYAKYADKYRTEIQKLEHPIENAIQLTNFLRTRAKEEAFKNQPTLAAYLKERREQCEYLVPILQEFMKSDERLRAQNKWLVELIEKQLQELDEKDVTITNLTRQIQEKNQIIRQREETIRQHNQTPQNADEVIVQIEGNNAAHDTYITQLQNSIWRYRFIGIPLALICVAGGIFGGHYLWR